MKTWVLLAGMLLPVASLAEDRTPAPLPPAKAVASMIVPDGFRVTLVAAEPDVVQPISFTIDARGRLWVAEALNYGDWKATGKDRIVILEDTRRRRPAESAPSSTRASTTSPASKSASAACG